MENIYTYIVYARRQLFVGRRMILFFFPHSPINRAMMTAATAAPTTISATTYSLKIHSIIFMLFSFFFFHSLCTLELLRKYSENENFEKMNEPKT